jgi:ectoine hydroxylase-related dioxygenase (phytanoyl-CoA dioxygenase family)
MVEDLSTRHEVIDARFCSSDADHRLNAEQLAFFEENGYLAGIQVLSAEQVAQLLDELTELMDPDSPGNALFHEYNSNESPDPDRVLFHALGAWRVAPGFHDLLWQCAYLQPASQLLGGPVRFWHDQLFCKPAQHGGVVAWHQDYSYWTRTKPLAHLTCFVALDQTTRENGCIHYVPGSHKWDLLPITGLAGDMEAIREVLDDEQWARFQQPVAIELAPGECVFHHGLTVHGSFENASDRPRRATVINVFRDGVCSDSTEPPLEGIPPVAPGAPMAGTFFPLLYEGD